MLKSEIRILGFDDGSFVPRSKTLVPVIGVIFRGGKFLDGALKTDVMEDGNEATEKIIELINSSRHKPQLRVLMFDGITLAGFNLIDIKKVNEETNLPVIVVNRRKPNLIKVKKALQKFPDFAERWIKVKHAGKIKECGLKDRKIYFQAVGMPDEDATEVLNISSTRSYIPEPLRVAHMIATAVVRGESSGHA